MKILGGGISESIFITTNALCFVKVTVKRGDAYAYIYIYIYITGSEKKFPTIICDHLGMHSNGQVTAVGVNLQNSAQQSTDGV